MSLYQMQKMINTVAKVAEDNEKFMIPLLSAKLAKLAEAHPDDQTIVMISDVLAKLSSRSFFINRGELKELYQKLYSPKTKFAEYFAQELGTMHKLASAQYAPKTDNSKVSLYGKTDEILANALESAFDKTAALVTYSKEMAQKAKVSVGSNLDGWNLKASRVEVEAGNERFLIVQADYETPKGLTSIMVPVEVYQDKVLFPSVFIANAGPQDLNHENLKNYLLGAAGKSLKIKASEVLTALTNAVSKKRELSGAELALTKLNASREKKASVLGEQMVGFEVGAAPRNAVAMIRTSEADSFEEKFNHPVGQASFKFGANKVGLGREMVARTIVSLGFSSPQVSVIDSDAQSVFYAVSVNGTAFKVPVKFSSNRVSAPDMMICNGSVQPLNKNNIQKLLVNQETDYKVAAVSSPQYGLKPSELVENVQLAVSEGNLAKAEDALNILHQAGETKAYQVALGYFVGGLGMKKEAEVKSQCSKIIRHASSQHPICSHTGLPVHKVYQDEFGNCLPAYRKNSQLNKDEAGVFINYKIFG